MNAKVHISTFLMILVLAPATLAAEIRGVITRIDPEKMEVVLEARGVGVRGTVMVFTLDKNSQILIGQQPGQLNMLAPGKHIRLSFDTRDGKNMVQSLRANALGALLAKPAAPAPALPADPNTVAGKLLRIGLTDREIIVIGPGLKGPQTETTLLVPEEVKITRADKAIKLDDLKEGEQVAVRHQQRDGKLTAESIQVGPGGAVQQPQRPFLGRMREGLKMADEVLQQMEQGGLKR